MGVKLQAQKKEENIGMLFRVAALACGFMTATVAQAARPSICGALWWMPYQATATQRDYEQCIDMQRAVGFDLLWICGSRNLMKKATQNEKDHKPHDPLDMVLRIADEKAMRVIVDLPQCGWYGKAKAEDVARQVAEHVQVFWNRYGKHRSLYGWYLNYEISPQSMIAPQESAWWRNVWRDITASCHHASPRSAVTISPFFMMDDKSRRGFSYLTPTQYAAWWEETLLETKIDVLMLQDSGAEHLALFTLADREPFFAAMQAACRRANTRFWGNVEVAEADVASWDAFISLERQKKEVPFRVVPTDKLAGKIDLASRYAEELVSWGYFPFFASEAVGMEPTASQREAHLHYKQYRFP
jgi:hypothetical protein